MVLAVHVIVTKSKELPEKENTNDKWLEFFGHFRLSFPPQGSYILPADQNMESMIYKLRWKRKEKSTQLWTLTEMTPRRQKITSENSICTSQNPSEKSWNSHNARFFLSWSDVTRVGKKTTTFSSYVMLSWYYPRPFLCILFYCRLAIGDRHGEG